MLLSCSALVVFIFHTTTEQETTLTMTLSRHYNVTLQSDDNDCTMLKRRSPTDVHSSDPPNSLVSMRHLANSSDRMVGSFSSPKREGRVRSLPIRVINSISSTSLSSNNVIDTDNISIITRTSSSSSISTMVAASPPSSPPRGGSGASSRSSFGNSASNIRSRFLYKLGIDQHKSVIDGRPLMASSASQRPSIRPRSDSFQESLKADYGLPANADDDDDNTASDSDSGSTSSSASTCKVGGGSGSDNNGTTRAKGVSFDVRVTVHPIPLRTQYSSRIRNSLWTPVSELQENAARNCVEFAAENWDWRQAAEDDDMVIYHGEKIHPIHFVAHNEDQPILLLDATAATATGSIAVEQEQEFSLRRMLFSVLSAQKQET